MKKVKQILKNKIFIISSIILIILLGLFISFFFLGPSFLKINGEEEIYISYTDEYKEQGATFINKQFSKNIRINNEIDKKIIGTYKIEYNVNILFYKFQKIRIVHIIDDKIPTINLNGNDSVSICPMASYEEEGFTATDEYDGDLTDKVIVNSINDEIIYEVKDSSGNLAKVIRKIIKEDNIKPTISLNGNSTVYVRNGANYYESGTTIIDNCDNNIKVVTKGTVNTYVDGTYILTYTATDSSGNTSSIQRKVIVYTDNRVGVVYLTFDDGPSGTGSTELILNVLKNEGVRGTFFVTGSGPDYLIKRAYDEGHSIGIHTYTHQYSSIYSSLDNYYYDLNRIKQRIVNITGFEPTITRFPGGSNNTVSNNYNYGIMNVLTKDIVSKGYSYFDWNVSANDAGICYDKSCVYRSVVNNLSKNRVNVVLMHDSKMYTANALQDIIRYCKENGYIFEVITKDTMPVRFK